MKLFKTFAMLGCLISSASIYAGIVPAKIGSVVDDENIKRTLVIFKNYDDAVKQKNECDVQGTEVPAFLLGKNEMVPACWEPARSDGIGSFRYTNQNNEKEFSFNERSIKFKPTKIDTVKHTILK
ncbi:hypothetical protein [Acinetobacter modestus]|uniref:hypothetical protein n=1 Tax=Acinetobacter modestus TaxID=1776740 RepID=UPI003019DA49